MSRTDFHKVIIGRAELLGFIFDDEKVTVPAKVDTGAYRSAVHADNVRLSDDGKTLHFTLFGNHPVCGPLARDLSTDTFKQVTVENSFGHREERYEVRLRVSLGAKTFNSAFTLANRSKKIYPILMGRKLLNNRFLVDTAQSSIDRVELKREYGIAFPNDEEDNDT